MWDAMVMRLDAASEVSALWYRSLAILCTAREAEVVTRSLTLSTLTC